MLCHPPADAAAECDGPEYSRLSAPLATPAVSLQNSGQSWGEPSGSSLNRGRLAADPHQRFTGAFSRSCRLCSVASQSTSQVNDELAQLLSQLSWVSGRSPNPRITQYGRDARPPRPLPGCSVSVLLGIGLSRSLCRNQTFFNILRTSRVGERL